LLYKVTLNFTGMKEYGVSFAASMAEDVAPPVEGARYSMLLWRAQRPGRKVALSRGRFKCRVGLA
jgi:hypothetical protein